MIICLTGGRGFLGQHVWRQLLAEKHSIQVLPGRAICDLRSAPIDFAEGTDCLVHLAYPGTKGIQTSLEAAADLVRDQLLIDLNVITQAAYRGIRIVTIGSVCSYPEQVTYPAGEDQLWSGYPEAINAPYGIAKRMQQGLLEAYRRQYGLQSTQLVLGNLYGPGDQSGHVIPSLIRRARQAKKDQGSLVVWGSGKASREFLYVEDAARAVVQAISVPPIAQPTNIVSGCEVTIDQLVRRIADLCEFSGEIHWDHTKPDGQLRRHFSRARAKAVLGWMPQVDFAEGLGHTVAWLRETERL